MRARATRRRGTLIGVPASTLGRAAAVALVAALLLPPVPTEAQTTLRVAAYNIKHGLGLDSIIDLERVADVLRPLDADVIALQEIDRGAERSGGVDQATRLGELLGMEAHFGDFMPYQGGEYGMAMLTRVPVQGVTNLRLPAGEEPRSALEVRLSVGERGTPVSVVGIHLYRTPEERLAQADSISAYFEEAEQPVVLVGDFNSRRGDRILRSLQAAEWLVLDKEGPVDTFPADAPVREIDFVMVRPAEVFEVREHRVIAEMLASDHRPLLAVLRIW